MEEHVLPRTADNPVNPTRFRGERPKSRGFTGVSSGGDTANESAQILQYLRASLSSRFVFVVVANKSHLICALSAADGLTADSAGLF